MQARRRILSLALLGALMLGGCSDERYVASLVRDAEHQRQLTTRCIAKNEQLVRMLEEQQGMRAAELAYLSGQATIAAACDFMLPLCPSSVAEPGRKAIADGIGVDRSLTFWAAVLAKLLVPVGLLVCTSVAMRWGRLRLLEPARARQEEARTLVETAQQRAQEAEERAVQAELRRELAEEALAQTRGTLREAQEELMQLDEDIAQAKQKLEQMRVESARQEALRRSFGRL